jgi:hypothetical protein
MDGQAPPVGQVDIGQEALVAAEQAGRNERTGELHIRTSLYRFS